MFFYTHTAPIRMMECDKDMTELLAPLFAAAVLPSFNSQQLIIVVISEMTLRYVRVSGNSHRFYHLIKKKKDCKRLQQLLPEKRTEYHKLRKIVEREKEGWIWEMTANTWQRWRSSHKKKEKKNEKKIYYC